MADFPETWPEGRYSIAHLGRTLVTQLPRVIGDAGTIPAGFTGDDKLTGEQRLAIQLRITKLMGCPVCQALFPPMATNAGFDDLQLEEALRGGDMALRPEVAAAADWAAAVLLSDGREPPGDVARSGYLSDQQRDHIATFTRLEMAIHAIGLSFLPHSMIERVWLG